MNKAEAEAHARKIAAFQGTTAKVVRILPEPVDPADPDDNGWDVEISITENE